MLPESSQSASSSAGPRAKYRLRFQKAGDLRLVSHHDLMHCLERMFRRAALPILFTQGFNPRPRMWFAQSLALGLVGAREVFELELSESLPAEEVHDRLGRQCPPGLNVLSVRAIDSRQSARVRRARYRLPLTEAVPDLPQRIEAFLQQPQCWIERTRPQRRRLDIRPYVSELSVGPTGLDMTLWITPHGAARPEEIVAALGLEALLQAGAVLERTDLELYDELPAEEATPPPLTGRPAVEEPKEEVNDRSDDRPGTPRPSAIVTGPLSFDS